MPTRKKAQDSLEAQGLPPAPDHAAMLAAQHEKAGLPTPDAQLVEVYTRDIERIMTGVGQVMADQATASGKHAEHQDGLKAVSTRLDSLEQHLTVLETRLNDLALAVNAGH